MNDQTSLDRNIRIRQARVDDLPALVALHVATFKETHGHRRAPNHALRDAQWRAAFERESHWFCYVAEAPDGQLVGFAKGELHDGGVPGFEGELDKIYVLRTWHRRGVGRALVEHVARRFLTEGVRSMLLFGDARNPSNGFYEHLGAERLFSPKGEFHGGYGWRDLRRLVPGAESDEGRVRSTLTVIPADPRTGYPETVLLRLIDSKGRPSVKIAATEDGSALGLGGESDPTGISIMARGTTTSIKLTNKDGHEQTYKP